VKNKNSTNYQLLGYFLIPFFGILIFKFISNNPSETFGDLIKENNFTTNTSLNKNSSDYINFNFDVKPILSDKCYTCHGPDENARKADLRLDLEQGFYGTLRMILINILLIEKILTKASLLKEFIIKIQMR